jgi:hypothetical protein
MSSRALRRLEREKGVDPALQVSDDSEADDRIVTNGFSFSMVPQLGIYNNFVQLAESNESSSDSSNVETQSDTVKDISNEIKSSGKAKKAKKAAKTTKAAQKATVSREKEENIEYHLFEN